MFMLSYLISGIHSGPGLFMNMHNLATSPVYAKVVIHSVVEAS
jgi:hypothetical protein